MAQEDTFLSAPQAPSRFHSELTRGRDLPLAQRAARTLVVNRLQAISHGRLEFLGAGSRFTFGAATEEFPLVGRVLVEDGAFWERLAWGGSIGAAEAYCDGLWNSPDPTRVIRVLARNQNALARFDSGTARITAPLRRLVHRTRTNTRSGSLRNISSHYDTGNEFFAQFLDPTLTYSCAIFPDETSSLDTAQRWKLDRICTRLELGPNDRLIEIGTGWGGLAIHAARNYGCEVVTTTISRRQFEYASRLVAEAGLGHKVTVLQEDYRTLPAEFRGAFDKLVSIEMIEAVGHEHLPHYFEHLSGLLKADGLGLIQAILMPDRRYEAYRRSVDFIQRYIFPGGLLPSLGRIQECVARKTDLHLVELDDLTPHYARTLNAWHRRFDDHEDRIAALGMSETERRKWQYYFSYCEGAFLERSVAAAHLLFAKPDNRRPAQEPDRF